MNLYIANGVYVGTQADAKKLDKHYTAVEVPTDKPGLISYLNATQVDSAKHQDLAEESRYHLAPVTTTDDYSLVDDGGDYEPSAPPRPMTATAIVARIDGGADVDEIAETICKARGYPLKRYAAAVSQALIEWSEKR